MVCYKLWGCAMECSVAAYVDGRRITLVMSSDLYDRFLDRRLRLRATASDMIAAMMDGGFIRLGEKPGEDATPRFLNWLDANGVRDLPLGNVQNHP